MTSLIYQFLVKLNESEGHWVRLLHNQPHGVASVLADNKKHNNMPNRKKKNKKKTSL